jgi:hypothetical protein
MISSVYDSSTAADSCGCGIAAQLIFTTCVSMLMAEAGAAGANVACTIAVCLSMQTRLLHLAA